MAKYKTLELHLHTMTTLKLGPNGNSSQIPRRGRRSPRISAYSVIRKEKSGGGGIRGAE